ncbi:unnamed protein product [Rhizophagus irregularis]|nr:unnamed protein product [Rhizophagus irregularis]
MAIIPAILETIILHFLLAGKAVKGLGLIVDDDDDVGDIGGGDVGNIGDIGDIGDICVVGVVGVVIIKLSLIFSLLRL